MLRLRLIRNLKFLPIVRPASTINSGPNDESDIVHRDGPLNIPLPEYPDKINEPLEKRRARLMYQSRKRGMLENDLLLSTFAAKYLKTMTEQQIIEYDTLINKVSNDWDIYYWAIGSKPTPVEYQNGVWSLFKTHVANAEREKRYTMPALTDK